MFRTTGTFQFQRTLTAAFLAALGTRPAAALLTTPTVILFTDGPTVTPDAVLANYTEATFHGYAGDTITLNGPGNLGTTWQGITASPSFLATTGGTINDQVLGYLVTDGATALYGGETFAEPVHFGAVGDFLDLDLIMPLPMVATPPL